MTKKKKLIILIIFGITLIGLVIALYFVLRSKSNTYPTKPIAQNSLSASTQTIDLGKTTIASSDITLYTVSTKVSLSKVEEFVTNVNSKLTQTVDEEGSYYGWEKGDDSVIYELEQNTVIFNITNGISWNEANLTGYSFEQFVYNYFGKTYKYELSGTQKMDTGETIYYAKRVLDNTNVEMILDKQETDYLALKNGKIVYGKILLSDLEKSGNTVPLLSKSDLSKYLNVEGYPKEVYPQYGSIQSTTFANIDYKSDDFYTIANTLSNCTSSSASLVYLYKSMDQGNLTPVYKLELQCKVTYNKTEYSVPAIGYVNAVNPDYISSSK